MGGVRRFRGRRHPGIDQAPTARLVERMQPPARAPAALVALEQRPQSGEAVRGDQPRGGQFGQPVFELGREQPGLALEVVEELRPAVAQHRVDPARARRERSGLAVRRSVGRGRAPRGDVAAVHEGDARGRGRRGA